MGTRVQTPWADTAAAGDPSTWKTESGALREKLTAGLARVDDLWVEQETLPPYIKGRATEEDS